MAKIRSQFQSMDKDGDGVLTTAELRKALSAAGADYTGKDVQKMVKEADRNGDGRVEWAEFLNMIVGEYQKLKWTESVKEVEGKEASGDEYSRAIQAFKIFDRNNDGMITLHELQDTMKELQLEQDPAKVEKLLKDLDKNGDGSLDYLEFTRLLGI